MRITPTVCLTVAALALPATASAAEYHVAPAGSGTTASGCAQAAPCPTIRDAVLASEASAAADTINVASGTYAVANDALFTALDTNLTVAGAGAGTLITTSAGSLAAVRAIGGADVTLRDLTVQAPVNAAVPAVFVGVSSTLHLARVTVSVQPSNTGMNLHAIAVSPTATATLDDVQATANANGQVLSSSGTTTVRRSTLTQNNTLIGSKVVQVIRGQTTIQDSTLAQTATTAGNTAVLAQPDAPNQPVGLRLDDDLITGGATTFATFTSFAGSAITLALNNDTLVPRLATAPLIDDGSTQPVSLSLNSDIVRATLPALPGVALTGCTFNDFPTGVVPGYPCSGTTNSDASALFAAGGFDLAPGSPAIDSGDPAAIAGEPPTDVLGRPRLSRSDGGCGAGRRDRGAYEYQNAGTAPSLSLAAPDTALPGQAVTFTPTASGSPAYAWSFGDGATSTTAGPTTHTYAAPGDYVVSLTVTAATGCAATQTRTVRVRAAVAGGGGGTLPAGAGISPPAAGGKDTKRPVLSVKAPKRVRPGQSVKLKIRLSEAARVSGRACRKVGRRSRCVTFSKRAKAGSRTLRVLAGRLKAGRYTLTVTATDAAGNVSRKVRLKLAVRLAQSSQA